MAAPTDDGLEPSVSRDYAGEGYWDSRYAGEEFPPQFDWLFTYAQVRPLIERFFRREHALCVPGCGNATLSPDMAAAGYGGLVNVDYSAVVIEQQRRRHPHMRRLLRRHRRQVRRRLPAHRAGRRDPRAAHVRRDGARA